MGRRYGYQQSGQGMVENVNRVPLQTREVDIIRLGFWLIVGTITLILMVQIGIMLHEINFSALLAGEGSLTGIIYDQAGHALAADVYVLGTQIRTQSDASGRFSVEDIPSGKQSIVINYHGMGGQYPVRINAGSQANMGDVHLPPN